RHAFAAAGFADDADGLPATEIEAYAIQNLSGTAEIDGEVADLKDGRLHQRSLKPGLNASFRPSPIRLRLRTVRKMARPGNVTVHQPSMRYSRLEPMMRPQLITLGSPSPRKLSPASNRMAIPTTSAAETMSGGAALGSTTRHMM